MKIETKFNVGDTVWFINGEKPCSMEISAINIKLGTLSSPMGNIIYSWENGTISGAPFIDYYFKDYGTHLLVNEVDCFSTKEELKNNLFS